MNERIAPRGRPKAEELATKRKDLYFKPSEWDVITSKLGRGQKVGTFLHDIIVEAISDDSTRNVMAPKGVPLLGYIPGGPSLEICEFPDGSEVFPPFEVGPDWYALVVIGDSMESEAGLSIPNGSYAFFSSSQVANYGSIVHVEWTEDEGATTQCTLKKFNVKSNGDVVLEPLNKKHRSIHRDKNRYRVMGIFMRAWDGNSEPR